MEGFFIWFEALDPQERANFLSGILGLNAVSVFGAIRGWIGWRHAGENLQHQINITKKLRDQLKDVEEAMRRFQPAEWLRRADDATKSGDTDEAARILRIGYQNISRDLAVVANRLAEHHLRRLPFEEEDTEAIEARRFSQLASLLAPEDQRYRTLALEIEEAEAATAFRAGQFDSGDDDQWAAAEAAAEPARAKTQLKTLEDRAAEHLERGRYYVAIRIAHLMLKLTRQGGLLGTTWEFTSRTLRADALRFCGCSDQALLEIDAYLPMQRAAFGEADRGVHRTRYVRAVALANLGRYDESMTEVTTLLAEQGKAYGPNERDTLLSRLHHATLIHIMGHHPAALKEIDALLPVQTRTLGEGDHHVILAKIVRLSILWGCGQANEALEGINNIIPIAERVLGKEHRDTLQARAIRARALFALGQPTEALAELDDFIPTYERILGPAHADVLQARSTRALTLSYKKRHEDALAECNAVLGTQTASLGVNHPETLSTLVIKARVLCRAKRHAEALEVVEAARDPLERILGVEHPLPLMLRHVKAHALAGLSDADAAISEIDHLSPTLVRVMGPHALEVLELLSLRAEALHHLGRHLEAIAQAEAVIQGGTEPTARKPFLQAKYVRARALAASGQVPEACSALAELLTHKDITNPEHLMELRREFGCDPETPAENRDHGDE